MDDTQKILTVISILFDVVVNLLIIPCIIYMLISTYKNNREAKRILNHVDQLMKSEKWINDMIKNDLEKANDKKP